MVIAEITRDSRSPSWHTKGLEAVVDITLLTTEIPKHSTLNDELVNASLALGSLKSKPPCRGFALAWLAHLDTTKYFIASDLDTVMIMELDVDWGLAIKSEMALISDTVRKLLTHRSERYSILRSVLGCALAWTLWRSYQERHAPIRVQQYNPRSSGAMGSLGRLVKIQNRQRQSRSPGNADGQTTNLLIWVCVESGECPESADMAESGRGSGFRTSSLVLAAGNDIFNASLSTRKSCTTTSP